MAKKRRSRNFASIPFNATMTVGTPTDNLVVKSDIASGFSDNFHVVSMDLGFAIRDLTAGEGPISCGVAHNDYSVTEIAEALSASSSTDRGDKVAQEQRKRLVRSVGNFPGIATGEVLNDGKPIRKKLNWLINESNTVAMWIQNLSGTTLTTGAILECVGVFYGYWK